MKAMNYLVHLFLIYTSNASKINLILLFKKLEGIYISCFIVLQRKDSYKFPVKTYTLFKWPCEKDCR